MGPHIVCNLSATFMCKPTQILEATTVTLFLVSSLPCLGILSVARSDNIPFRRPGGFGDWRALAVINLPPIRLLSPLVVSPFLLGSQRHRFCDLGLCLSEYHDQRDIVRM